MANVFKPTKLVVRLTASGVTRDAVIVLVKDRVGMSKGDIRAVLDSLRDLERDFCR